ncbi:MAG: hypothetical protein KME32_00960 [Mojavia pulchra JT2-VF2]|jgi:hypothetical protein|uniref:Uncharacterized protein n=1 Tax=Mojavia pulchra JT2-VF2 TaxID=287848 RepID=A0A951PTR4_9NOST|nr:hypothetical protein [Mojavia pulchra JT2-VF2]
MQINFDPKLNSEPVTETRSFEELSIVLVGNQINPTIIQPDFLKMSGIFPLDWELQQQPIVNSNMAQIVFKNGVSLIAQGRSVSFRETVSPENANQPQILNLANNFIDKLPYADYQGFSMNPKIIMVFPNGRDIGQEFIVGRLLSPGPWSSLGLAPVQAAVNFLYQLERCPLVLNLSSVEFQQADKVPLPALLFSGSFNYEVSSYGVSERVQQLKKLLANCLTDIEEFREIVKKRFWQQGDSVFPVR